MADGSVKRVVVDASYSPTIVHGLLQGLLGYVTANRCRWQIAMSDPQHFDQSAKESRIDGMLTLFRRTADDDRRVARLRKRRIAIVNMAHDIQDLAPSVHADEEAFGQAGAAYLMGLGFEQFAFIGFDTRWSDSRQAGFVKALRRAKHTCQVFTVPHIRGEPTWIEDPGRRRVLDDIARKLPRPIGVLACNDLNAYRLVSSCLSAGIRVPEDVAVLGVDNDILVCETSPVAISSISQDFQRLGFRAAELLDGLMNGRKSPRRPVLIPPGRVIARHSTNAFAFEDEHVSAALRLIHADLSAGITVKDVLAAVPVSRTWLQRQFRALVGRTPGEEIRRLRIEEAEYLLAHTSLPVAEVAARCGFSHVKHLSRAFHQARGASPREFRRSNA